MIDLSISRPRLELMVFGWLGPSFFSRMAIDLISNIFASSYLPIDLYNSAMLFRLVAVDGIETQHVVAGDSFALDPILTPPFLPRHMTYLLLTIK
jgi:hypothetical protein